MSSQLLPPEHYQLVDRESSDYGQPHEHSQADLETEQLIKSNYVDRPTLRSRTLLSYIPLRIRRLFKRSRGRISHSRLPRHGQYCRVPFSRRVLLFLILIGGGLLVLVTFIGIFRPSYTHLPPHYAALKAKSLESNELGRANPLNEKIFIAISLYDKGGHLASGTWGQTILDLIDLLGHNNVFLSIYENDSGDDGTAALDTFKTKVKCEHEIVSEAHVSKGLFPKITLPDGTERLKRITYLSEMRNRALRPLDQATATVYDKMLILNDISFYPIDAAQLLFSTHADIEGKANYLAACAVDFVNPMKFYDTYATRDMEGYSMGVPFFPFFSSAGGAHSRHDVLNQKDAVRVKSCWSGMVAFDAKYFQSSSKVPVNGSQEIGFHNIPPANPKAVSTPVRFRAEPEIFYDACECCLIQADVLRVAQRPNVEEDTGIYFNPYIRVAYSPTHLWWLQFTRRFERLYSIPHWIVNKLARMPTFNPHRTVEEGDEFSEEIWVPDSQKQKNGSWQIATRSARNGLYCGVRETQVILQTARKGDKNWENVPVPRGSKLW